MGADLTLLPVSSEQGSDLICRVALDLDLNQIISPLIGLAFEKLQGRLFAPIAELPVHLIEELFPEPFPYIGGPSQHSYFGEVKRTDEFRWATVKQIKTAWSDDSDCYDDLNDYENAGVAYIRALPDTTKVVFYWW